MSESEQDKRHRLEVYIHQCEQTIAALDRDGVREIIFSAGEMTFPMETSELPPEVIDGLKTALRKNIDDARKDME